MSEREEEFERESFQEATGESDSAPIGSMEAMRARLRSVNEDRLRSEQENLRKGSAKPSLSTGSRSSAPRSSAASVSNRSADGVTARPHVPAGKPVYMDWAATAPLSRTVVDAMMPFFAPGVAGILKGNGNANALHSAGRDAFKVLESARRDVARALDARPDEIVFTSGATEADNAALLGISEGALQRSSRGFHTLQKISARKPSVVVSAVEHEAVLEATDELSRLGLDVHYVRPDRSGHITPDALKEVLAHVYQPLLVSIMAVNNETGAVMDIPALADVAHRSGALFHTDATQAIGKIPLSVREWRVDALSFSAHKISGPKGVGVLYLKARTPFVAQIVGGGQEAKRRSGTQNIAGVVGLATALREAVLHQGNNAQRMRTLRDRLFNGLIANPGIEAVVDPTQGSYSPHIVALMCPGFESETLILQLDKRGICASGGSACSSQSLDPSHVLSAMGIERDQANSMLRLSIGPDTTVEEVDRCIAEVNDVLATARR